MKLSQGQFVIPGYIAYTKKETIIFHSQISAVYDLKCSVNCWSSCKMLTPLKLFILIFLLCYQFFFFPITPDCLTAVQKGSSERIKKRCVRVQLAKNQNKTKKHLHALHLSGSCDRTITYSVSLRSLETTRNTIKLEMPSQPCSTVIISCGSYVFHLCRLFQGLMNMSKMQ